MRWFDDRNAAKDFSVFDAFLEESDRNRVVSVLRDYERSDAGRRLDLWLGHRDLRPLFNAMEGTAGGGPSKGGNWMLFEMRLF